MRRHRDKRWREAEAARREAIRTRGKREERRQWTKGNNQSGQTRGNIGGEASANNRQRRLKSRRVWQEDKRRRWRRNEMRRDNQPGYNRQMGGVAPADKRQHCLKSQQRLETIEAEVALQEDKRRTQCVIKTRGRGGGGATRCDATTSQGKVKVNGRWTIPPLPSKNCSDDLEEEVRQKKRGHDDGRLQRGGRKTVAAAMTTTTLNPLKGLLLPPSCPMPMPAETKLLFKMKAMVASWQRQRQQ